MANTRPVHPDAVVVRAAVAAQMLDCSRGHIYQLMAGGQLRRIEIPGSKAVRIPTEDVYALLGMDAPTGAPS
jgi:excisionase family DNA binding protein